MTQVFEQSLARVASMVEAYLEHEFASTDQTPARLGAAMRHASLGGGKRLRPFLVTASAELFGIEASSAIPAAAALECVHCYSLVHDDLPAMDNDQLRRGRPTVWSAFDDWTAILAGDAILTLAFEIISRPETHPDPSVRSALALELARASGRAGMVGGQCLDLQSDKLGMPTHPDISYIRRMQGMKTGALLRFACVAGAILGNADDWAREALGRFGDHLGYAFQISDDLLDVEGSSKTIGKATGKDAVAGKATLAGLLGVDDARAALRQTTLDAVAALSPFNDRAKLLRDTARFVETRSS
ncbi:MAG: polyprenyl synthetase family protein [Hyphomicrobiaceae bacterium]